MTSQDKVHQDAKAAFWAAYEEDGKQTEFYLRAVISGILPDLIEIVRAEMEKRALGDALVGEEG